MKQILLFSLLLLTLALFSSQPSEQEAKTAEDSSRVGIVAKFKDGTQVEVINAPTSSDYVYQIKNRKMTCYGVARNSIAVPTKLECVSN